MNTLVPFWKSKFLTLTILETYIKYIYIYIWEESGESKFHLPLVSDL